MDFLRSLKPCLQFFYQRRISVFSFYWGGEQKLEARINYCLLKIIEFLTRIEIFPLMDGGILGRTDGLLVGRMDFW